MQLPSCVESPITTQQPQPDQIHSVLYYAHGAPGRRIHHSFLTDLAVIQEHQDRGWVILSYNPTADDIRRLLEDRGARLLL